MMLGSSPLDPGTLTAAFAAQGFVSVRPLFDAAAIARIDAELQRFIRDVVPTMPEAQVYYEDRADARSLKQLQKLFDHDGFFHDLMFDGPPRRIAEAVLGQPVVPVNMQFFNKPAGIGQATPAHQDGYFFHLDPCEAVTGWLALDPVDDENGCIHYVAGSHREPDFRSHAPSGVLGFSQGIPGFDPAAEGDTVTPCPAAPGDFLMHHARTIHWAGANRSATRGRRALGFIYYAEAARVDQAAARAYQAKLDEALRTAGKI